MSAMSHNEIGNCTKIKGATMSHNEPHYVTMPNNGSKWPTMSQNEPHWGTLIRNELQWIIISQNKPQVFRMSHRDPLCATLQVAVSAISWIDYHLSILGNHDSEIVLLSGNTAVSCL